MSEELLQNLGLTKNESKIYKALVNQKTASVNELARATDVPRVNIYGILESLKAKGLAGTITKSNKMYFSPSDPKRLEELYHEKQKEMLTLKNEINSLSSIFNDSGIKHEVGVYKGVMGIKSILKDSLDSKTEIINFGSSGFFQKFHTTYYDIWENRRANNKIKLRVITSISVKGTLRQSKLHYIRYLKYHFENKTSTFVYDNKVAMFMWVDEPIAILIENKDLADSNRNYFEALWKDAKP